MKDYPLERLLNLLFDKGIIAAGERKEILDLCRLGHL